MQRRPLNIPTERTVPPYGDITIVLPDEIDDPREEDTVGFIRQNKYLRSYDKIARNMRLLGLSTEAIANVFEVDVSCLGFWRKKYPSFNEAWWIGGPVADAKVARSLYKRACGYNRKVIRIVTGEKGTTTTEYTEHYPPDTRAGEVWLYNRQAALWKHTTNTALTNGDGTNLKMPPNINVMVIEAPKKDANTINGHAVAINGSTGNGT